LRLTAVFFENYFFIIDSACLKAVLMAYKPLVFFVSLAGEYDLFGRINFQIGMKLELLIK